MLSFLNGFAACSLDDVSATEGRENTYGRTPHQLAPLNRTNNEQQDAPILSEHEEAGSVTEAVVSEQRATASSTETSVSESEPKYLHAYFETLYYFGTNPYRTTELRARQQDTGITRIMNAMQKV